MKKQITSKRFIAILIALVAMVTTASADWTTYDGSVLPGDADFNVKNGAGEVAVLTLVDDAENPGNKILQFMSGEADKNTLEAPKFDSKVSGGGVKQAFTVVMRARAISSDPAYKNFMEVEVKDGEIRDKVRFYPEKGLDIEKANGKELKSYPDGHNSYDFNIYRITFKDGITTVYINDVQVDQSVAASTTSSDSDSRFVIGDSNSGADYGVEYDWIIWDNGDAYAPGEGADYPEGYVLAPLSSEEPPVASTEWVVYDASSLPEDAGWNVKNGAGDAATIALVDDAENSGNKILRFISGEADKNTLEAPKFDSKVSNGGTKQAFTVVMRARAYQTADMAYKNFMEVEVKDGEIRDKVRFYPEKGLDIEKANGKELKSYPDGHNSYDFNIYRVTFKDGITMVWVNDVLVDESVAASTTGSDSDSRFVIGDSNSGADYGIEYDWIIWDNGDAYAPGEGADYPTDLVLAPLAGGGGTAPGEDNWLVYDGGTTPIDYGFSPSTSNTSAANETAMPIDDPENAGNKLLELKTEDDKASKLSFSQSLSGEFVVENGFTVVMRAKATAEEHDMIELYLKSGTHYEKFRFYTDSGNLNQEKGWDENTKVNYPVPDGVSMLDWNVYRITMKESVLNVWVNDILIAKDILSTNSETTTTNFGFGDGNSGSTYSALVDWIIWDETGAYAPIENSNYPSSLVIAPLTGGEVVIPDFLYFDETSVAVAQAGETLSEIGLEANAGWELSTDDGWITSISPIEGDSGKAVFSFQAFSNDGPAPRTGKIYGLIGGVKMDSLLVTQEGVAEKLTVNTVIASTEQVNETKFNYATNVNDGADTTGWAPAAAIINGESEWIKLGLAEKSEVAVVKITEAKSNERRTAFKVDYWNGSEYVEVLEKQLTPVQSEANAEMSFAFDGAVETDTIMFTFYGNTSNSETDPDAAQGWFTYRQLTVWGGEIDDTGIYDTHVNFKVYPNPTSGSFVIDNAEGAEIKLISLSGKVMYQKSNISGNEQVNIDLQKGLYILKVDQAVTKVVIR